MTTKAFVGPAGSGKTTRLMEEIEAWIAARPLSPDHRILAITRMHGARHRLEDRLRGGSARGRFDCTTLDRLAWTIAARWRSLAASLGMPVPAELDFDGTCAVAARLLEDVRVGRWLVSRFPLVVVDEVQDCRDARLAIVRAIGRTAHVLVAADEFQDLSGEGGSPAVEWLTAEAEMVKCEKVHRTDDSRLLAAATAIRTGAALSAGWGTGFSLAPSKNANVAAKFICQEIQWARGRQVVVLSPTGPGKSPFVARALARVAEKPFEDKRGKPMGPFTLRWEDSAEAAQSALWRALGSEEKATQVDRPVFSNKVPLAGQRALETWLEGQRRLAGRTSFTGAELAVAVTRAVQHHRAHARPSRGLRAMTIQQAKNQEFDQVVVLWPFEVQGDADKLRRLLYNAVTRARTKAVVVVQQIDKDRLATAPFA